MKFTRIEGILVTAISVLAGAFLALFAMVEHRLAPIRKQLDVADAQKRIAEIQNDLIKTYPEMAPSASPAPQNPPAAPPVSAAPATTPATPAPILTPVPAPTPPNSP